jgi:hypothetical protein
MRCGRGIIGIFLSIWALLKLVSSLGSQNPNVYS